MIVIHQIIFICIAFFLQNSKLAWLYVQFFVFWELVIYCSLLNNPDNFCVSAINTNAINWYMFIYMIKKLSNIYLIYFANKIFEYGAVCPWEVINVLRWVLSFKIMKIISQFQDVSIQAWFFEVKFPMFHCVLCLYAQYSKFSLCLMMSSICHHFSIYTVSIYIVLYFSFCLVCIYVAYSG